MIKLENVVLASPEQMEVLSEKEESAIEKQKTDDTKLIFQSIVSLFH